MNGDDLLIWTASNEPYAPTCVAFRNDTGLSVSLYHDDAGAIIGGTVWNREGDFVTAFGLVPAEIIEDIAA